MTGSHRRAAVTATELRRTGVAGGRGGRGLSFQPQNRLTQYAPSAQFLHTAFTHMIHCSAAALSTLCCTQVGVVPKLCSYVSVIFFPGF
jgi:hypothetical protein